MQRRRLVAIAAMAMAYAGPCAAITDCSKPKTKVEWMLCSSDRAAIEEQRMAMAFRLAAGRAADRRKLLEDQADWNAKVRDACNDIECLSKAYRTRTEELEAY